MTKPDTKALRGLLENRHPPYEYCGAYRCNVTGIGHVEMRNNYCDLWSEKQLLQAINALPDLLDAYEERDRLKAALVEIANYGRGEFPSLNNMADGFNATQKIAEEALEPKQ